MTDSIPNTKVRQQPAVIIPTATKGKRRSNRLAAKTRQTNASINPSHIDVAKDVYRQLENISQQISLLALDRSNSPHRQPPKPLDILPPVLEQPDDEDGQVGSFESDKTLVQPDLGFRVVESQEKEISEKLFAPLDSVPKVSELKKCLGSNLKAKIPIHHHIYELLQQQEVDKKLLEDNFTIVEKVGNICPRLTPRVETALMSNNISVGTESMQQHVLDAFLMGVIGTAQDNLEMDVAVDRNAAEPSMTLPQQRPDYLLMINGQLVFKGEEKKGGNVRNIAVELTDKMLEGVVGKKGKLEYLLGYATAGSRVLFECIHGEHKMTECSDIFNLLRPSDRVSMVLMLVNVVRVARALLLAKQN